MNYPAFEVFGTQHLVTLLICALVIYAYPKYFANQSPAKQAHEPVWLDFDLQSIWDMRKSQGHISTG